jgi:hypothetical protein
MATRKQRERGSLGRFTGVGEFFRHLRSRDFCQTNSNGCKDCSKASPLPACLKYRLQFGALAAFR